MKKKLFAILLTFAMVVAYMPAMAITAFADGAAGVAPVANTLTYNGNDRALVTAGTAPEGYTMQYKLDNGEWGNTVPTGKDAGKHTVSYQAVSGDAAHPTFKGDIPVEIEQANPVTKAPTIIAAQQYTGKPIDLINKGVVANGTMTYRVGSWSSIWGWGSSAQAIEVGSYDVYYKVTPTDTKNYKTIEATKIAGTAKIVPPVKVELQYTSYAYNGQYKTPTIVKVTGYDGKEIPATAYKVTGETSAIMPGTHKFTVSGTTADYKWSTECTWKITVKKTSIKSLKKGSKSFTVKVKELDEDQVTGYQVRYSTKSSMSGAKTKKIGSSSDVVKKTVKSLKKGKKYYVQVRSYMVINGIQYNSGWSAKKTVKTK